MREFPVDGAGAVSGANKVQDLVALTQAQKPMDYVPADGAAVPPTEVVTVWELNPDPEFVGDNRGVFRTRVDLQGNVVVAWGDLAVVDDRRFISVYSASGILVQTFTAAVGKDSTASPLVSEGIREIALDNGGGIYTGSDQAHNPSFGGSQLMRYRKVPDFESEVGWKYQLHWTLTVNSGEATGLVGAANVRAIEYVASLDRLYVLQQLVDGAVNPIFLTIIANPTSSSPEILVRYELLDAAALEMDNVPGTGFRTGTGLAVRDDGKFWVSLGVDSPAIGCSSPPKTLLYPEPTIPAGVGAAPVGGLIVAGGASTYELGALAEYDHEDSGAGAESGGGMDVILCNDGMNAFIAGPRKDNLATTFTARFDVSEVRQPASGLVLDLEEYDSVAAQPLNEQMQLAVDGRENVYVPGPFFVAPGASYGLKVFHRYPTDFVAPGSFIALLDYDTNATPADAQGCVSCAVRPPLLETDYEGDLSADVDACIAGTAATSCSRAEYVYLAMFPNKLGGGSVDQKSLRKIQIVTSDQNADGPREVKYLAVANGLLKVSDGANWIAPSLDDDKPLNSATLARYIESATVLSKRYFVTGGEKYGVYDPREDEFIELLASRGELPGKCALVAQYHGRLVLARSATDGPHAWFMSKVEDPTDWDEAPAIETRDQAISGTNLGGPLQVGDIINTLVPITDDLLLFGCDRSIWMLRGDPLGADGQLDNVTTEVGMAFGRPWTRDRRGRLWFIDSEGGLALMLGAQIERISENRLEARLRNVNQSTHYYRLAWDNEQEGLHIFVLPFGTPPVTTTEHWFYSPRGSGFWPQKTDVSGISAVATFDSDDPDDRRVALGFGDGRVRLFDSGEETDDATNINAFIDIPIVPNDTEQRWRFQNLHVSLDRDGGGCNFELHGLNDSDEPLVTPAVSGRLLPGRNRSPGKVTSPFPVLRLQDSSDRRVSIESMFIEMGEPVGRRHR